MKKLILLSLFVISCSNEDFGENITDSNDNNGWNGNVFSFNKIDINAQWTLDKERQPISKPISNPVVFQKQISTLSSLKINQSNINYEDSLDVGILQIDSPKTGELASNEKVSVIIGNYGYLPIFDSLQISLRLKYEDQDFGDKIFETVVLKDSIAPVEAIEYHFNSELDFSEKGVYYLEVNTEMNGDMDSSNNSFLKEIKSLQYSDVCNIHSLIFYDDNKFKLYTLDEEGLCNYVIFGEYLYEKDNNLIRLYSPDSSIDANLIGNIYDVSSDDNGDFSGTIDIDGICIQLEDGYKEELYSEGLTYVPDNNLEKYLIEIGLDDIEDGYITNSQAASLSSIAIEATDNYEQGGSVDFWNFEERFTNRISNLAGVEAFPNLSQILLTGQNLDSINISMNSSLKTFNANFNTFKTLNTDNNPDLELLSIDSNEVPPILNFSNNSKLKSLSTPMCSIEGFIGEGGYYDISNLTELEFLDLYDNKLSSVDITKNTKLKEIRINIGNEISSIDFSNNLILETILANNSGLKGSLDISNLSELKILNIGYNDVNSIDLSNNTKLEYLELNGNKIEGEIDVSNCTNLLEFYANSGNNITCIKVNQNQLDAYNGTSVPDGFKWELSIEPTLVCD